MPSVQQHSTWIGVVRTNFLGSLLAAWPYETDTTASEIGELPEGIVKAMECARNMPIKQLLLRSDAKDLVACFQLNNFDYQPRLASRMSHAQDLWLSFRKWSIEYVPRSSNFLAHSIAQRDKV